MTSSSPSVFALLGVALVLAACGSEPGAGAEGEGDVSDAPLTLPAPDDTDAGGEADAPREVVRNPYPEPGAWPANQGPGGPARTFTTDELRVNCAYLDGGPLDDSDHHNLVQMFDGYLVMPWSPEYGTGGLTFFDISDPCAPVAVGSGYSEDMRETHSLGFAEIDGRWYTVVDAIDLDAGTFPLPTGIQLWDVTDSSAPTPVARLDLPGSSYPSAYPNVTLSTAFQAPYIYAASADTGVFVVDASDPQQPVVVGHHVFDPLLRAGQVQVIGDLLVTGAAEEARTVLNDVSVPEILAPIPGGDFLLQDPTGRTHEPYFNNVANGSVYYARKDSGGGLFIVDIRDPTQPTWQGLVESFGAGGYVFVQHDKAFVGESNFASIYDISDPSQPVWETMDLTWAGEGFTLVGDLDTATPIGNILVLAVDDKSELDKATAMAPWREEPDTRPPVVTWVWPADGADNLKPSSRLGIGFDEFVDPKSAWDGSVRVYETGTDPAVTRREGWISTQEVLVNFTPKLPLEPGVSYTLEVPAGGVADISGNAIQTPFTATFTVASTGSGVGPSDPLVAEAGQNAQGVTGELLTLDASSSTGAVTWIWDLGDDEQVLVGETIQASWSTPGRYQVVLTVKDADGLAQTDQIVVTITHPITHSPNQSGTMAFLDLDTLAAVDQEAGAIDILSLDGGTLTLSDTITACERPRRIAAWQGLPVVSCRDGDQVRRYGLDGQSVGVALGDGARPSGVLAAEAGLFVALQGAGRVVLISDPDAFEVTDVWEGFPDVRGLAELPDGRVAASRWRSPDGQGLIQVLDPASGAIETWPLAFVDLPSSDTGSPGVPAYLDQLLVSPNGREMAVPSLQANTRDGLFLNGEDLRDDTTLRAVLSWVGFTDGDVAAGERIDDRKIFDNRGFASAGAFNAAGDYLFVAQRGTRAIDRIDALTGALSGTIENVGYAPDGVVVSPDGELLIVDATLEREVRAYDLTGATLNNPAVATVTRPTTLPYDETQLRGRQLFNDSLDPRLSHDGYIACAHCHLDGESDRLTWDFTGRGEGMRNTISLLGRQGTAHGPIHWSGNFDEVQDFEHDLRGPFGGVGLMADADFEAGTVSESLGDPKAGLSEDLDALAAYVTALDAFPTSPHPPNAEGEALFTSPEAGCTDCHEAPAYTDSAWLSASRPKLHDVGTLTPASGQRLGEPITGIDTPTLRGLWNSAPYLHDGSAATLNDVLTERNPDDLHGDTSHLTEAQLQSLVGYLLSL